MAGRKLTLTYETIQTLGSYLAAGATDKDSCERLGIPASTFYNWLVKGEKAQEKAVDKRNKNELTWASLYDVVTAARANAKMRASKTVFDAINPHDELTESTETFTETRLDKSGNPYDYTRVVTKQTVVKNTGDWRAAIEYLKRRDPEQWGDKLKIEGLEEVLKAIMEAGLKPKDLFNAILKELGHEPKSNSSGGS